MELSSFHFIPSPINQDDRDLEGREHNLVSECRQEWEKISHTYLHLIDQQKNKNNRAHLFIKSASDLSIADF